MAAIITITFSPCIDKSTTVPLLISEKKLKCTSPRFEPGGGGINVARAIKKLGGEATTIYPAGGHTGKFFNRLLSEENIPAIIVETESETRENIIVLEQSSNRQYRFGMPGSLLKENEWQQIMHIIEEMEGVEFIVVSGSSPPGVPPGILGEIATTAKNKKARLVVDTSGESLKMAAMQGVYLMKPNLGELGALVNKEFLQPGEIASAAYSIIEKGGAEIIVVSMGEAGAMLVTHTISRTILPPPVSRKSTVGAGDSMVAGIVLALSRGKNIEEASQFGVACGTAATMNPGTELCHREDAENLFRRIIETDNQ
jgi:6-phosphofructokinase 2